MVQATGTGVGFFEGVLATAAVIALWRVGAALRHLSDAAGIVARETRRLRELAEVMDDE
jgi:hypothetical protein